MYFWLILLMILGLGAMYVTGFGGGDGETSYGMTYLTIFGVGMVLAGVLRLIFSSGGAAFKHTFSWIAVIGLVLTGYNYRVEVADLYERLTGEHVPNVALTRTGGEAELRRAWDGHYRADAKVNGVQMRLLVDTGASMVLLPFEGIEKVGVDPKKLNYSVPVSTANGRSSVAPIRIGSITIGDIQVSDVTAAVAQPGALKMGLLGMSFLDQLNETVFQGDRLILRQDAIGADFDQRFKRVPGTVNGMFTPEEMRDQPQPY